MTKTGTNRKICRAALACAICFAMLTGDAAAEKRSQRVLYLGDSQSIGAFGKTFDRSMRSSGLEVYTVVAGGSSPYYWLKTYKSIPSSIGYWEKSPSGERRTGFIRAVPKLETLLQKHKPNVVVVQTGINLYATLRSRRHSKEENRKQVKSLIDQMCLATTKAGAKSYWILPPHSHTKKYPDSLQDELRAIMSESVSRFQGEIFESQKFTQFTDPYPATDGIHYGSEDSVLWANKVGIHFANYMKVTRYKVTSNIAKGLPIQPVTSLRSNTSALMPERSAPAYSSTNKKASGNDFAPVDLVLKLVKKSEIKNPNQASYDRALGMFEYEVIKVRKGDYQFDRIRIVHGIMFRKKLTSSARRKIGDTIELTLVPRAKYPNLATWHLENQIGDNDSLPVYTPRLD